MSLLFWRRTRDIDPQNSQVVAVTEDTPLPVRPMLSDEDEPLSVKVVETHSASYTQATHTAVTITTTSSVAVAANGVRRYLSLCNDSDVAIYVEWDGGAAVASVGQRINANGGSYEMSKALDNLFLGTIRAIHAGTGDKVLLVTEGV